MRIGICGAHGTGKTSLARRLSEVTGYPLVGEAARDVARELGILSASQVAGNPAVAGTFQEKVLELQLERERAAGRAFVADRTSLDCAAYWWLYGCGLPGELDDYVRRAVDHAVGAYDLVVEVAADGSGPEPDGFRDTCRCCRRMAALFVTNLVRMGRLYGMPSAVTVAGAPEERLARVLAEVVFRRGENWLPEEWKYRMTLAEVAAFRRAWRRRAYRWDGIQLRRARPATDGEGGERSEAAASAGIAVPAGAV